MHARSDAHARQQITPCLVSCKKYQERDRQTAQVKKITSTNFILLPWICLKLFFALCARNLKYYRKAQPGATRMLSQLYTLYIYKYVILILRRSLPIPFASDAMPYFLEPLIFSANSYTSDLMMIHTYIFSKSTINFQRQVFMRSMYRQKHEQ